MSASRFRRDSFSGSTLIQHFNGLIKAASGELYYEGKNIYEDGYDMKYLRSQVGLVFQYPEHQLFEVDVLTDVCFGPKNQGLSKEECEKRAKEALELVGFPEELYLQSPFELSGGQKRRAAIAGVLAMRPKVLVLYGRYREICGSNYCDEPRGKVFRWNAPGSVCTLSGTGRGWPCCAAGNLHYARSAAEWTAGRQ